MGALFLYQDSLIKKAIVAVSVSIIIIKGLSRVFVVWEGDICLGKKDYEAGARLQGQLISLRFSSFCSFHGVDLLLAYRLHWHLSYTNSLQLRTTQLARS